MVARALPGGGGSAARARASAACFAACRAAQGAAPRSPSLRLGNAGVGAGAGIAAFRSFIEALSVDLAAGGGLLNPRDWTTLDSALAMAGVLPFPLELLVFFDIVPIPAMHFVDQVRGRARGPVTDTYGKALSNGVTYVQQLTLFGPPRPRCPSRGGARPCYG